MGHTGHDAGKRTGAALLILLGAGAFWDGLYGPGQQLVGVLLVALLALTMRGAARLARLEWLALLLLGVGVVLSLRAPAAAGVAAHGPVIAAGWVLALVAGRLFTQRAEGEAEVNLARFWAVVGALMAFGGLVAISFTPLHHSGRLGSFLGYPIAVGVLGLLGLAGALPDLAAGRPRAAVLALGNGLAVLLSGSRGVWAVGVLLLLYLTWAAPDLVRRGMRRAAAPLGTALVAALWAAPAVAERDPAPLAWIVLLGIWTVWLLDRFHEKRHLWLLAAAGGGILLALAPGWSWLLGRATALPLTEGSSVERLTFLRDGLGLVARWPWGAGYRGWTALHLQSASYGYYSAEVHSAPLDLAIAFGWAGGLAFLLLLGRFLWQLRHGRPLAEARLVVLAGLAALAVHSLLDWDLSYGLFAFPLWFGFGMWAPSAPPPGVAKAPPAAPPWPAWLTVGLAGLALAGVALLGAGDLFTGLAGNSLRRGSPETALLHAGAAVAVTPWNDLAHAYRGQAQASLGLPGPAVNSLQQARALGPREPWYAQLLARELAKQGRWMESAAAWRQSVALWPWHVPAYEEALQAHVDLIRRAQGAGEESQARALAESGEAVLAAMADQKAREPAGAPRRGMQVDTPAIQQATAVIREILAR